MTSQISNRKAEKDLVFKNSNEICQKTRSGRRKRTTVFDSASNIASSTVNSSVTFKITQHSVINVLKK